MHIQNFKTFCDLVESKSFSKAAKLNEVTQSAVSQQLKAMESHYQMLIIDRNQKKFRLTPQGNALYDTFKQILTLYDRLNCEIQEMRNVVSGTIQISTVNSIGLHVLPDYLKSFIKEFPSVNARVEYRRANLVYEDILHGSADIGLVAFPEPNKDLFITPFANDELIVALSPDHPFNQKSMIKLKDLQGVEFIAFEKDIPTRKATDKILADAGVDVVDALTRLADLLDAPQQPEIIAERGHYPLGAGAIDASELGKVIANRLPDNAIVCDEGATNGLGAFLLTANAAPHDWLTLTGGAIGQGLPLAIGAAVACPDRKVLALEADGSGMYTVQALWTMVREALDVTVMILNNGSYAILNIELSRVGVEAPGPTALSLLDLTNPEIQWTDVARGLGMQATRVSTVTALDAALEASLSHRGPALIEVVL